MPLPLFLTSRRRWLQHVSVLSGTVGDRLASQVAVISRQLNGQRRSGTYVTQSMMTQEGRPIG